MSEHTKEPWLVYQDGKREMNNINHFIKSTYGDLVTYGHMSELDAIRIVACVNACEGISTETLEQRGMIPVSDIEQQRDELLAVLRVIANGGTYAGNQFHELAEIAQHAISKAEAA